MRRFGTSSGACAAGRAFERVYELRDLDVFNRFRDLRPGQLAP